MSERGDVGDRSEPPGDGGKTQPIDASPPPAEPTPSAGSTPPLHAPAPTPTPPASNGMALAALILGIVALVFSFIPILGAFIAFPLGIVAIILGVLGRSRAKEVASGAGLAMAGIILGAVALVITVLWAVGAALYLVIFEQEVEDFFEEIERFDPQAVGLFLRLPG